MYHEAILPWVYEYIVTLHLLKAVELDRRHAAGMKLSRAWEPFFEALSRSVEREHIRVKRQLRRQGCKIVMEEMQPNRNVHVMYVYKGYEHHCIVMPWVLKDKCEEKLKRLLFAEA